MLFGETKLAPAKRSPTVTDLKWAQTLEFLVSNPTNSRVTRESAT